VDLILQDKAGAAKILAPASNNNYCIHYKENLLKDEKVK
jgi:hypothetical protein